MGGGMGGGVIKCERVVRDRCTGDAGMAGAVGDIS